VGRVIDGRYRVAGRLGAGGMGVVYKVEHLHLGKTAAMKVLAPETAARPDMVRRFRLEAQAVSKLNHPNIVQTFDFGQADGALYLVMEYIKGDDLASLLRRDGPWPFTRAARLFAQVCSGLTEAHEAGIVHRDLKPENLMVVARRDGSEHAKVLDFGLAKLRERADSGAAGMSSGGAVLGTPYYMAPEQVRGESLDGRADVYSLGATLYRVLTGEPPFDAPSPMSVLAKHLTDDVVPPRSRAPALPPEADRIVLRAMAKSRDQRYASAAEIQLDLERAATAATSAAASAPTLALRPPDISTTTPPAAASTAARPPTGASLPADSDPAVDVDRLRRADVDDYEWSLHRARLVRRIIIPVVVAAVGAVAAVLLWRGGTPRADAVEREPNNTPGYANPIVSGGAVRGTIGAPVSDREGDVDYFRIPAGRGPRTVQARLEGIPGVDLVLELFDAQGKRLAKGDAHGRGLGEWIQPTTIPQTESYLAVRELWTDGTPPTANAPDPYTLTARWGPPPPDWEVEPNDWPEAATPIPPSGRVRGYLGSPEDRDWFSIVSPTAGKLEGTVEVPAGIDVVVMLGGTANRTVDRKSAGEAEAFSLDVEPGRPALIGIARKVDTRKDPKEQSLPGLEDPYELVVRLP
jgi:serine/threonine-protein kinase